MVEWCSNSLAVHDLDKPTAARPKAHLYQCHSQARPSLQALYINTLISANGRLYGPTYCCRMHAEVRP